MARFEFLLNDSGQRRIIEIVADERHSTSNEITQHPVETGVSISDHIRPNPKSFNITGVISNTPFGLFAVNNPTLAEDSYDLLLQYSEQGRPMELFTGLRDYGNVVIRQMEVTRDVRTSNGLHISLGLQQISTSRVEESSEFPRREPEDGSRSRSSDLGQKTKRPASPALGDFTTSLGGIG